MGERHPGAERHPAGGERHHAADPQARLKERHLPPPAHSAHAAGSSEPHRKELNRQRVSLLRDHSGESHSSMSDVMLRNGQHGRKFVRVGFRLRAL